MIRLGLIADIHGLLRPEARLALADVERIIHAGEICKAEMLDPLAQIAPVVAVRGNNDRGRTIAPKTHYLQQFTERFVSGHGKVFTRRDHAPRNSNIMRTLAMDLLRLNPLKKKLPMIPLQACPDSAYLAQVLDVEA